MKRRLIRRSQSQRTGMVIDAKVIEDWIEREQRDGALKGFQKIKQGFALDDRNVTQGFFAVDDVENASAYFVIDVQQMRGKTEQVCVVAGVEFDPVSGEAVGEVDVHVEHGTANYVRGHTQITVNGVRVFIVDADTPRKLIDGDYRLWGAN